MERIPASRFERLPKGLSVIVENSRPRKAIVTGKREHGHEVMQDGPLFAALEDVFLDFSNPETILLHVPTLISSVKGAWWATREPAAVSRGATPGFVLIAFVNADNQPIPFKPMDKPIYGSTREECYMNGLLAALEATR